MVNFLRLRLVCFFLLTILIGCGGGPMADEKNRFPGMKDVSDSQWNRLSQQKIYFGHQSVGFNIIDGIKDVMKENPRIKLNIIETTKPSDFNAPIFGHSRVGKNQDPRSKIYAFETFLREGIGKAADIAFLKFCYVDIAGGTDVKSLLKDYKESMASLKENYPQVRFIHLTVPLTTVKATWKTWIKELTGKKDIWEYAGNIRKKQFNDLLRTEYEGKEPVFDLAKIESTYPDGTRSSFSSNGITYYSLVPEDTKDGGHLNEKGRKIVAEQFLIFLANLAK
jgi:hypothetical protein